MNSATWMCSVYFLGVTVCTYRVWVCDDATQNAIHDLILFFYDMFKQLC